MATFPEVDYYATLSVSPDASEDTIRQAYIKESLRWHPDRNSAPEATQKFQDVAQAYFVLSDSQRRSEFDRARREHRKFGMDEKVDAETVFGGVFDELLTPEVPNPVWFWEPIGGIAGFMMGFIVFNIPGALFGAYSGKKMGKVRDMKGVSVYEAFAKLEQPRKSEILSSLAGKLFKSAF
ncbi:DnaJ-domain-containing protein [Phlyctochytrium arcticum]|nr:DnaJ-domain-containing protein [Phlyctochytrium arcticum]